MKLFYYLSPDIAIINLNEGNILFKSDVAAIKLEGESTKFIIQNIFPHLDGETDFEYVASQFKNIASEDLKLNLDKLVAAGVLRCEEQPRSSFHEGSISKSFLNFLSTLGISNSIASERLKALKVAIIGLEGHGTQTAFALQQAGIGALKLVDPFPTDNDYLFQFPFLKSIGQNDSKQKSLSAYLTSLDNKLKIKIGPEDLSKETLEDFISDCDMIIVCFDKGFSAIFYWVNEISIDKNIPAIYAAVKGHICFTGPLVVPDKTCCYMCYKMRNVATHIDFEEAMTYEEYLNNQKTPALYKRNLLPSSSNFIAGTLSNEVLKYLLSIGPLLLAGKIHEFNTLTLESLTHTILQKPDCPVCQKKKFNHLNYTLSEIFDKHTQSNLEALIPDLTSAHSGIIKKLENLAKDITEPIAPYVFVADLANHSFLSKDKFHTLNCSGKGMTLQNAQVSAVGEAVERYSGGIYFDNEIIYENFNKLNGFALNPSQLVLYLPQQYPNIPFEPYNNDAMIGWVKAYSLIHNSSIYVPAHAVFINYNLKYKSEYICQPTSNGLAAGATILNAILSAALEVIERDAFMITWHNELPVQRIDPLKHPSRDIVDLCIAYQRRGVELQLYRLPTDTPCHIFLGIGVQKSGDGPKIVVGLGADFSASKAAQQALLEVGQVRPAFRQRLRLPETQERLNELLADPKNVEELEDHDLLYATSKYQEAFDFLFQQPVKDYEWDKEDGRSSKEKLNLLLTFLRSANSDLIYYNLTPLDMERLGLYTARVIIPDFQPIHFGWKNIRLAGNRLYEIPQKLGLRKKRTDLAQLNMNPHPLA